jgi:hypothetical protein
MLLAYFYKRDNQKGIKKREELIRNFFNDVKPLESIS